MLVHPIYRIFVSINSLFLVLCFFLVFRSSMHLEAIAISVILFFAIAFISEKLDNSWKSDNFMDKNAEKKP